VSNVLFVYLATLSAGGLAGADARMCQGHARSPEPDPLDIALLVVRDPILARKVHLKCKNETRSETA
jgi:hypothetical protein